MDILINPNVVFAHTESWKVSLEDSICLRFNYVI